MRTGLRMLTLASVCVVAGFGVSCSAHRKAATFREAYQRAKSEGFEDHVQLLRGEMKRGQPAFGYEPQVIPQMKAPETRSAYVFPYKVGEDIAIGGYWIKVIVRPFRWSEDLYSDRTPAKAGQSAMLPSVPGKGPSD